MVFLIFLIYLYCCFNVLGIKLSLTDNEITHDLNNLRGIVDKNEEMQDENKISPTKMELEEIGDKQSNNDKNEQKKSDAMEEESLEDIDEIEEKKSKSDEEENEIDNNNNNNSGLHSNKHGVHGNKRKSNNNSKNYSLRKIINIKQAVLKTESEDSKSKEKIDSRRVLRNRKK